MMNCSWIGCPCMATGTPKLMIPATGAPEPIDPFGCIQVLIHVPVCRAHFDEMAKHPEVFLAPEVVERVSNMAEGQVPPAFDRAFLAQVVMS